MAADDNDPPKNPFVRWKQHVDAHIGLTLNGLLGIPSIVSKNLNIRRDSDDNPGSVTSENASGAAGTAGAPGASSATSSSSAASANASAPASDENVLDDVDASQLLEWHKFIYYSPYSPLELQQQQYQHLLPPPIPQDVPFGADPYAFSYADAFEDLLRASSNRPLIDLVARSYRNIRYQMRYGSAIEPPYVFFHRMHSERLLDAYFPRGTAAAAAAATAAVAAGAATTADTPNDGVVQAVAAMNEDRHLWKESRANEEKEAGYDEGVDRQEAKQHDGDSEEVDDDDFDPYDDFDDAVYDWEHSHEHNANNTNNSNSPLPAPRTSHGGLFEELDRVFRVLSRIIDEDTGAADAKKKADPNAPASDGTPSAEDELYLTVRSAYAKAEKSLSTLVKAVTNFSTDHSSSSTSHTEMRSDSTTSFQRGPIPDGRQGETIHKTEEHTDAFGNRHVKTTVRRLDADGREIARETRYTIRSSTTHEAIPEVVDDEEPLAKKPALEQAKDSSKAPAKDVQTAEKAAEPVKKPGWFWK